MFPLATRISRNDPCPCGSGKKYKKCCLEKEHKKELAQRKLSTMISKDSPYCKNMGSIFSDLKNMNKSLKEIKEEAENAPKKEDDGETSPLKKLITKG